MQIDFNQVLTDLDGRPVKQQDNTGVKDATLGSIVCLALLAIYQDEQQLSSEEKLRRFNLAEVVHRANGQAIDEEDIALIKQLIAKAFGPLIVGRAYTLLGQ